MLPTHPTTRPALRYRQPRHPMPTRGFALIEALIALLIFSFAALGLVGLQTSLVRATGSAKYRAEAAYLATDLIGTIWADAASLSRYGDSCASHTPCAAWLAKVTARLPGGSATLAVNPVSGTVTVRLDWRVPGEGGHRYETTTSVNANATLTP